MYKLIGFLSIYVLLISCTSKMERGAKIYNTYCSSCHLKPSIDDLPKEIWANGILPEMGYRLGIRDTSYDPLEGMSFKEKEAVYRSRTYPDKPLIEEDDWLALKEYVMTMAPEKLPVQQQPFDNNEIYQFSAREISLDSVKGAYITYLKYDDKNNRILYGDFFGNLDSYDLSKKKSTHIGFFGSAITDYTNKGNVSFVTTVGNLNPSEQILGSILVIKNDTVNRIPGNFHRPVNTLVHDLNKDGHDELVVSEFGNLTGQISLLVSKGGLNYEKRTLLNKPGTIRVLAKDMDKDGLDDLVVLSAQGDESIYIFYQMEDLKFKMERVFRFSPIYGSSWFEMVDFDGDGDDDIVVANGDNMDKSYMAKPYHGIRILVNDGSNKFEEKCFVALNGATRVTAKDFDKDGDIDFGVICSFPDYVNRPKYSMVYLENENSETFSFKKFILKQAEKGRWFLIDSGDIDHDGDEDMIISAFSYAITPEPNKELENRFTNDIDIMILENKYFKADTRLSDGQ